MTNKYNINDTIECDAIVGWVKAIYVDVNNPLSFVYGIEEPESEAILLFSEAELSTTNHD